MFLRGFSNYATVGLCETHVKVKCEEMNDMGAGEQHNLSLGANSAFISFPLRVRLDWFLLKYVFWIHLHVQCFDAFILGPWRDPIADLAMLSIWVGFRFSYFILGNSPHKIGQSIWAQELIKQGLLKLPQVFFWRPPSKKLLNKLPTTHEKVVLSKGDCVIEVVHSVRHPMREV